VSSKPEELAKWGKDNDRAMFYIMSSISDEVLMNSNTSSAKELWDSIASAYGLAKEEKVYHIYHRIITTKMASSDNASEHVAKFKTMFQQVESMNETLSEKFKIAVLLVSLPDSYNVKRQILYEKEKQMFNDVCESVIGHVPEGHASASDSADKVLASFLKKGDKKKGKYKGRPCEHCRKSNHSVNTCYDIHGYPNNYKGPRSQFTSDEPGKASSAVKKEWIFTATVVNDNVDGVLDSCSANVAGLKESKDEWCTDSGATRNITCHLDILHDV